MAMINDELLDSIMAGKAIVIIYITCTFLSVHKAIISATTAAHTTGGLTGAVLGRQGPSFEQRQLPILPPLISL